MTKSRMFKAIERVHVAAIRYTHYRYLREAGLRHRAALEVLAGCSGASERTIERDIADYREALDEMPEVQFMDEVTEDIVSAVKG